jgi:hypothetical protein
VFKRLVISLVSALALAAVLTAQEEGGGGGGAFAGGAEGGGGIRPPTRFEQFIGKLKMDPKTQGPLVTAMLEEASKDASPIGQEMAKLQNDLVNAILLNKPETEIKAIVDAYTVAAAKMTGLEARTFAKVYALLKPNQQGGAVQAFDLMAGWLQPPPPGGRGGGGGGGQ